MKDRRLRRVLWLMAMTQRALKARKAGERMNILTRMEMLKGILSEMKSGYAAAYLAREA